MTTYKPDRINNDFLGWDGSWDVGTVLFGLPAFLSRLSYTFWATGIDLTNELLGGTTGVGYDRLDLDTLVDPLRWATSDLSIRGARLGETRAMPFVIENNTAQPVKLTLKALPWVDRNGQVVPGEAAVHFEPDAVALMPGEQASITVSVQVEAPLLAGNHYQTEIMLNGRSITLSLTVMADTRYRSYRVSDSGRLRASRIQTASRDTFIEL
ncbi:MAG: hypothetical protein K8J31_02600 [Anaerolineae bacterium]|nr:hypothetical protein [Anaerolineae bacterium]